MSQLIHPSSICDERHFANPNSSCHRCVSIPARTGFRPIGTLVHLGNLRGWRAGLGDGRSDRGCRPEGRISPFRQRNVVRADLQRRSVESRDSSRKPGAVPGDPTRARWTQASTDAPCARGKPLSPHDGGWQPIGLDARFRSTSNYPDAARDDVRVTSIASSAQFAEATGASASTAVSRLFVIRHGARLSVPAPIPSPLSDQRTDGLRRLALRTERRFRRTLPERSAVIWPARFARLRSNLRH